jgi:outer membrane usher protein
VAVVAFFTNSIGRFAIQNLQPGVHYRVVLLDGPVGFDFTVPPDTSGLVDLKIQTLSAIKGK